MSGVWTGSGWSDGPLPSPGATLDAFSADPFGDAGQVQPKGWTAPNGVLAFCLGHDAPGFTAFVAAGDYVEASQTAKFPTGPSVMLVAARTRAPKVTPTGCHWIASVLIDDEMYTQRVLVGKRANDWGLGTDADVHSLCVDTTKLDTSINHKIAFRLSLVGSFTDTDPLEPSIFLPFADAEIPAFYVDDVRFVAISDTVTPIICAVTPPNGSGLSTGDPIGSFQTIFVDIFDTGSTGTDLLSLTISVFDGVSTIPVMTGGSFDTGWTGFVTSPSTEGPTKTRIQIQPTSPLTSGKQYTFTVGAGLFVPVTQSISFTYVVADTIAPSMVAAKIVDLKRVRVTWSEAIELLDPNGVADGLNPTLYSLVPTLPDDTTPAVTPIVVGVSIVSDGDPSIIDLLLDVEVTPGIVYTLSESGVSDLAGNLGADTIDADTYTLPAPAGRRFDLYRMLPTKNRLEDTTKDLLRFIRCLQEVVDLLLIDIDNFTTIVDPDIAPEPFLDAMLEDIGNPFPFELTETQKRSLLRILVSLYEQKGTNLGIINAIRFFTGIIVTIEPYSGNVMKLGVSKLGLDWILGPGTLFARFAFKIVSPDNLTDAQRATMTSIARYMKDARTHLTAIIEPSSTPVYDPLVLGISKLGVDWRLH